MNGNQDGPADDRWGGRPASLSPATLQALFGEAVRCHQAGRLAEAEQLYRQILAADAGHADSLHFLGLVALQTGRKAVAIDLIGQAIALRNDVPAYYNNLGNALLGHGRPAEAVVQYERAIALKPDYVQAHNNLGNALKAQGMLADATAQYRRALALNPNYAEAHNNLGSALQDQGNFADAVVHCERAIALRPDYAEAHNNLGLALQGQHKLTEAVAHYQRALALKPESPQVYSNLGNALLAEGRLDEAIAHYRRALELAPDYPQAHNNLGLALRDKGDLAEAVVQHERALELDPNYAQAHHNLAGALHDQGRQAEAVAHYQRALALKPDYAQAQYNMGIVLQQLGRLAQAQEAFEKAIDLAPRTARYYRPLIDGRRIVAGDRYLAAMERLARDMASLPDDDQTELHFALGKAYADLEQHERSFEHLLAGNALRRRGIAYDEAGTLAFLDRVRGVFTPALLRDRQGLGDPSTLPVFIIGMPRSGTTLVEQILASHPRVFGAGERDAFRRAVDNVDAPDHAPSAYPEMAPALSGDALRQIGARYVAALATLAPNAARITDKMPGNFEYVGLIHLALPNTRIIHMRRDPIDTCVSCFSIRFATGLPQSYDLVELGRYYRAYATLMDHWRQVLPPGVMLDVQYEDVVADLDAQARRIVAHCGLEWNDACLAFHRTDRPVHTASAAQVRQPIYRTSVGRWRPYEHLLQPLIKELGVRV